MNATKWVLTIKTDDGVTVHVEAPHKADLDAAVVEIEKQFGPMGERGSMKQEAATWECSGVDGCLVS